jgi:hypothetical protein
MPDVPKTVAAPDRPQLERPRLLARNLGYVEVDPERPFASASKAMAHEPEPVRDDELERLTRRSRIAREHRLADAVSVFLAVLDEVSATASAAERRRLRNAQRVIRAL